MPLVAVWLHLLDIWDCAVLLSQRVSITAEEVSSIRFGLLVTDLRALKNYSGRNNSKSSKSSFIWSRASFEAQNILIKINPEKKKGTSDIMQHLRHHMSWTLFIPAASEQKVNSWQETGSLKLCSSCIDSLIFHFQNERLTLSQWGQSKFSSGKGGCLLPLITS